MQGQSILVVKWGVIMSGSHAGFDDDSTRKFSLVEERGKEMRLVLSAVYDALAEKGYNPINQIVGYLLSEDPTYITNHKNARVLIRKIDRDEFLQELVRDFLL